MAPEKRVIGIFSTTRAIKIEGKILVLNQLYCRGNDPAELGGRPVGYVKKRTFVQRLVCTYQFVPYRPKEGAMRAIHVYCMYKEGSA